MSSGAPDLDRICTHCGAVDSHKLGQCTVCYMSVCERCGNIQHIHGERRPIHNSCLAEGDHGFTMIKFVK
jgi:translation initiation factor 2 beta subunit (eIF-2beta)/eIF-5